MKLTSGDGQIYTVHAIIVSKLDSDCLVIHEFMQPLPFDMTPCPNGLEPDSLKF